MKFPLDSLLQATTSWVGSGEGMRAERVTSGPWCAVAPAGTKDHDASRVLATWAVPDVAETGG